MTPTHNVAVSEYVRSRYQWWADALHLAPHLGGWRYTSSTGITTKTKVLKALR